MPVWAWIVSGAGALGLLCCGGLIAAAILAPPVDKTADPARTTGAPTTAVAPTTNTATAPGQTPSATPPATTAAADPASGWPAFAASGAVPPSVLNVVTLVRWDGLALVAETKIYNDSDAPDIARKVCSAVSAYALTSGGFKPVQVLGSAGELLVSRHSLGEQCTWRG